MTRKLGHAFCILAVCLAIVSCRKLDTETPRMSGPAFELAKFTDAIPDDYGTLIGVTQNPQSAKWVGLWFQRPDKSITAVFVNIEQGKIYEKALTIPRK
jgi:hypothetical protein